MPSLIPKSHADSVAAMGQLLERRLLVFLGKGGVGKSTLTAAMGKLLAARGKRVLLCEVNAVTDGPASSQARLPPALGVSPMLPVPPEITEVLPGLFICNLRPEDALHEYVLLKLKIARVVEKLLNNRPVRSFLRLIPSLSEVVTLGKLLYHVREQKGRGYRFDAVLLDAPATGHGVSLLNVPQVLLGNLPPGPMRDDLAWMNALLVDPAVTSVQLVTLAEELPVNETLELDGALRNELSLARGLCFVNGIWPERFTPAELREIEARTPRSVFDAARRLQTQADVNRQQLARLREALDLPIVELPQAFDAGSAAAVTERVQQQLESLLPGTPPNKLPAVRGAKK